MISSPLRSTLQALPARRHGRWAIFYSSAGAVWVGAALFGWSAMLEHAYRPQATGEAVTRWPQTGIEVSTLGHRIVVFAHPLCPCTQATLDTIDELLTRLPQTASVHVVFCTAGLDAQAIAHSRSLAFARRLPGVVVCCDETGEEARRFGATISGEVFAFDPDGRRVFHGGITPGRGHRGTSAGRDQLEHLLAGRHHEPCTSSVFGCALPFGDKPLSR